MKGKKSKLFKNKPIVIGVAVVSGVLAIGVAAQAISLDDINGVLTKANEGIKAVGTQLKAVVSGSDQVFAEDTKNKDKVDPNGSRGDLLSYDPFALTEEAGKAAPDAEVPTNFNKASLILGKGEANKILGKAGQAARKKQLDQVDSLVEDSYYNASDIYENSDVVENMDSSQEILKVLAANDVGKANIAYMNNTLLAKSYELQQAGLQQAAVTNQLQAAALSNSMGSLQQQKILNAGLGYAAEQAAVDLGNSPK